MKYTSLAITDFYFNKKDSAQVSWLSHMIHDCGTSKSKIDIIEP